MALRMETYAALLRQGLLRSRQVQRNTYPRILPIVIYNGEPQWSAAVNVNALIEDGPECLDPYQPAAQYLLLDQGRLEDHPAHATANLAAAIMRIEHPRSMEAYFESVA
jgi:hypothetical protein